MAIQIPKVNIDAVVAELKETNQPFHVGVKKALNITSLGALSNPALLAAVKAQILQCDNCKYWKASSEVLGARSKQCAACRAGGSKPESEAPVG